MRVRVGVGVGAEVMDPEVELNFHGALGTWKVPGETEAVCSYHTWSRKTPERLCNPSVPLALGSLLPHGALGVMAHHCRSP